MRKRIFGQETLARPILPALKSFTLGAAMEFMAQSRWEEAARAIRRVLAVRDDPHIWVQYGHALKEAGYFAAAKEAYRHAQERSPGDFDIKLQMGHLHKLTANFEAAARSYKEAFDLCGDESRKEGIAGLFEPLAELKPHPAVKGCENARLIFSCVTKASQEQELANRSLGRANYSYSFAMRGFQRAADLFGVEWKFVSAPHYVSDLKQITTAERPVHLAFYPPHLARLLKGAYNILCFAWEFPLLPRQKPYAHAFSDPRRMLDLFDEIWVPSSHGVEIVRNYTKRPVKFAPSPIVAARPQPLPEAASGDKKADLAERLRHVQWAPLSIFPRLQSNFNGHAAARQRRTSQLFTRIRPGDVSHVFLSVFNPHDQRKQIRPLIDGFLAFAKEDRKALLLLKTASPDDDNTTINQRLLTHQLASDDTLLAPYISDRVWITNQTLSDEDMSALYRLADFYVCTSYAEGQNLPLLEAMQHGTIPASAAHTAMADSISESHAIVIPHTVGDAPLPMQEIYRTWGTATQFVSADDVCDALRTASRLSESRRSEMSAACRAVIERKFGAALLETLLSDSGVLPAALARASQ